MTDIRDRALAGETLLGAFLDLGSPMSAEICGQAGFDWVVIDLEHGVGTEASLLAHLHAIGDTPAAALVRPQSGERLRIGRALDLGADGVMVPRVDTAEQVREAVAYMRYPPAGDRGVALRIRGAGLGRAATARSARSTSGRSASSRSSLPRPSPRPSRSRRSTARTCCSSGRPTCRTRSASRAGSTSRSISPRSTRSLRPARRHGKAAGILLYEPAVDRPAPRTRVHVHRAGLGRRVRHERRQGDARGRRPGLTVTRPRRGPRASAVPPRPARSGRSQRRR